MNAKRIFVGAMLVGVCWLACGGTLQRTIPTTSDFARKTLVKETAAEWRQQLGLQGITQVTNSVVTNVTSVSTLSTNTASVDDTLLVNVKSGTNYTPMNITVGDIITSRGLQSEAQVASAVNTASNAISSTVSGTVLQAINTASNSVTTLNVRQYGAVPDDGIYDDVAFAAAFNAGRSIYVPEGEFNFTNTIYATNIRTLGGAGAKSKLVFSPFAGFSVNGISNTLDVVNLKIERAGSTNNYYTNTVAGNQAGLLLWAIGDADGISRVQNVSFANFPSNAVTVIGDTDINTRRNTAILTDNYITNCNVGIFIGVNNAGEYTSILRNTILGCNWAVKRYSPNVQIVGNVMRECANGLLLSQSANGRGHGIVTDNIINHIGTAAYVLMAPSSVIDVSGCTTGLIIANNQMQGNGSSYIYFLNSSSVLMTGNLLELGEMKFAGGNTNIITGNMFYNSSLNAVTHNVGGNTDKTQVTGNWAAYGKFNHDDY